MIDEYISLKAMTGAFTRSLAILERLQHSLVATSTIHVVAALAVAVRPAKVPRSGGSRDRSRVVNVFITKP